MTNVIDALRYNLTIIELMKKRRHNAEKVGSNFFALESDVIKAIETPPRQDICTFS